MPALQFDGRLESDQGACFIRVPPQTLRALGEGKRAPVKVTLNGYTYRTTIAVYGGKSYIGVRREVREAAGVAAGDRLAVGLEYDAQVRTVDLPQVLRVGARGGRRHRCRVREALLHAPEGVRSVGDRGETGGDPAAADGAGDRDAAWAAGAALTVQAALRCRRE